MPRIETLHRFVRLTSLGLIGAASLAGIIGCQTARYDAELPTPPPIVDHLTPAVEMQETQPAAAELLPVSFEHRAAARNNAVNGPAEPPRIDQFDQLPRRPMSLDTAVELALNNSTIVNDLGGRVLTMPDSVTSTLDPGLVATDPQIGVDAALSNYDLQLESGLVYNGGGNIVNSAFSSGQFGVFAQPETLAKMGVGRVLSTGTSVNLGGVAGYDQRLAGGPFAALGGELRHPLLRGAGREFNEIAGPSRRPGLYGGILVARSRHQQSQLALEDAVGNLVRDVATTYWELQYAYFDVGTKQTALQSAARTWRRAQEHVAAKAVAADQAALAEQQMHASQAALVSAISGSHYPGSGVYSTELRLRTLLGLPTADGSLIYPETTPLTAEFRFDWQESLQLAHVNRVELRRQAEVIEQTEMEIKAARNLQRTQVDLLGAFRKLGDDPDTASPLFGEALDGWQVGVEVRRSVSNRLENAAVRNARLRHRRAIAVRQSQQLQIDAQVQAAMTRLDRCWNMIGALTAAESAARLRLESQAKRQQAGEERIEEVLQAQVQLTQAATTRYRAIVDYNLAFIELHHARGTLLPAIGVGVSDATSEECRFAQRSASVYMR